MHAAAAAAAACTRKDGISASRGKDIDKHFYRASNLTPRITSRAKSASSQIFLQLSGHRRNPKRLRPALLLDRQGRYHDCLSYCSRFRGGAAQQATALSDSDCHNILLLATTATTTTTDTTMNTATALNSDTRTSWQHQLIGVSGGYSNDENDNSNSEAFRRKITVAMVFAALFNDTLQVSMLVPLLPSLIRQTELDENVSEIAMGIFFASKDIFQLLGAPLAGWITQVVYVLVRIT